MFILCAYINENNTIGIEAYGVQRVMVLVVRVYNKAPGVHYSAHLRMGTELHSRACPAAMWPNHRGAAAASGQDTHTTRECARKPFRKTC